MSSLPKNVLTLWFKPFSRPHFVGSTHTHKLTQLYTHTNDTDIHYTQKGITFLLSLCSNLILCVQLHGFITTYSLKHCLLNTVIVMTFLWLGMLRYSTAGK